MAAYSLDLRTRVLQDWDEPRSRHSGQMRSSSPPSLASFVNADLGFLTAPMRNGQIQAALVGNEQ